MTRATRKTVRPRRPTGNIRERSGGFEVRWTDAEGRRKQATLKAREDAEQFLRVRLAEAEERRRGVLRLAPPTRTLGELASAWLTAKAMKRSHRHDESILRAHVIPHFGEDRKIASITFDAIERFKRERMNGRVRNVRVCEGASAEASLHPNTINHHLALLCSMLRYAKRLGWLESVPYIERHKVEVCSTKFRYLVNKDEVRRFLEAAREESIDVFDFYATALFTGARAGELAALTWFDVNFALGLVHVHRSFDGPPKSGRARQVVLLDVLKPILRARRQRVGATPFVFQSRSGTQLTPSARIFQEVLVRVIKRAGLPAKHITFHGLRHTFASMMMEDGMDLFRLQRLLGHQSSAMTLRYAHLSPSAYAADRARLAGFMFDSRTSD